MTAISELASKEYQIERSIHSKQTDWEEVFSIQLASIVTSVMLGAYRSQAL